MTVMRHTKIVEGSADKKKFNILLRDLKSNTYFRNINTTKKQDNYVGKGSPALISSNNNHQHSEIILFELTVWLHCFQNFNARQVYCFTIQFSFQRFRILAQTNMLQNGEHELGTFARASFLAQPVQLYGPEQQCRQLEGVTRLFVLLFIRHVYLLCDHLPRSLLP